MENKILSSHKNSEPESRVLYIVSTPIGNLEDISLRALNILKNVSLIACEDTRQTMKLMSNFKFSNKLISFNKENSFSKIPRLINDLNSGESVALVSDAGMPGICDPGEDLIKEVRLNGTNIICVPGPCAPLTALVCSGFQSSKFIFEGFLPKKKSEREKILLNISSNEKTTVLFESPHRLIKLLNELKEFCGGRREIKVVRELTKKYEEHIGNNIDEVLYHFSRKEIMGEITVVIKGVNKPKKNDKFDDLKIKKELSELIKAGLSLSSASRYLAKKNNISKNLIYKLY